MFQRFEDYEALAFLVIAVGFELAERASPSRRLAPDRRHLRDDLIGFALLLAVFNGARFLYSSGLRPAAAELGDSLATLRALPSAAKMILAVVAVDFVLYWTHRSMHRFGPMWRTHMWHHSPERLHWLSGMRTSVLHVLVYAIPQVVIPVVVFDLSLYELAAVSAIAVWVQVYTHANVGGEVPGLSWLFVSPRAHRIHHARSAHRNRNFGMLLTVWDRLFGTWQDPREVDHDFELGLDAPEPKRRLLVGI